MLAYPVRMLFSEKFLGITNYEIQRLKMPNIVVDQKKLVFEMKTNNVEELVRTTKQWIHHMNKRNCETDFMLLQQSLRHIHNNPSASKMYNFGPTVMRMLHYLNMPGHALKVGFLYFRLFEYYNNDKSLLVLLNNGYYFSNSFHGLAHFCRFGR